MLLNYLNRFVVVSAVALMGIIAPPTSITASAETHYRAHVSVGAHGGLTMSRMSFAPEVPQSWLFGPTLGVQVRYAEEKLVGVIAEFNFTNRGWKETLEYNPDLRYSRSLYYLSIPILTHVNFGSDRTRCIINLGPEIGFMVGDKISSNFDYKNAYSSGLLPSTRRVNQMSMDISGRFDYGITAGLGCEQYLNPRNSIYIEGRFYYGLGNIYPSKKADEFSASRSMSITVTLGYNFRMK